MNKLFLVSLLSLFLLTGCLAQFDVTQLQQVQDFLKEHPGASIRVNLWDEATVQANAQLIEEACQQQLPVKKYWYVTIEEKDTSIKLWVDRDSQDVVCAFKKGSEKSGASEVKSDGGIEDSQASDDLDNEMNELDNELDNSNPEEQELPEQKNKEYKGSWSYDSCTINSDAIKVTLGVNEDGSLVEHNFEEVPDFARMTNVEIGNKIYFGDIGIEIITVSDDEVSFKTIGTDEVTTVPASVKTLATVAGVQMKFGYRVEWNGIRALYVIKCD